MKLVKQLKNQGLQSRGIYDDLAGANLGYAGSGLFGTIANKAIPVPNGLDFFPLDGNGSIMHTDGSNVKADWLGLESKMQQFWAYSYCMPLASIIDKLAEADSNGILEYKDKKGITVSNYKKNPKLNRVITLLKKPNPYQTWQEFNSEQIVYCKIFGYCPVLPICPSGMDKSHSIALFNMNALLVTPEFSTGFDLMNVAGTQHPIKTWRYNFLGKNYTLDGKDVLMVRDGFISSSYGQHVLPQSKIAGCEYFISNICKAMEADNVLLSKKGPLGVFSFDPKPDVGGWQPLEQEDKMELQSDLGNYGLSMGQLQYVISKLPMKWNPMSFNVQELMTKETVRQGIDGLCDRFGYPAELMSGKNATYENRSSAESFLYQNNIIPFSIRRMATYSDFFEIDDYSLTLDYDHLPVLQEDIVHAGTAFKAKAEGTSVLWKDGVITMNEYRNLLDRDTVADGEIYYPEWAEKNNIKTNTNVSQNQEQPPAKKDTSSTK